MKTLTVSNHPPVIFRWFFSGRSKGAGSKGNPLKMPRSVSCVPEKQLLVQRRMPVGRRAAFFLDTWPIEGNIFRSCNQKNLQMKEGSDFFLGWCLFRGVWKRENNMQHFKMQFDGHLEGKTAMAVMGRPMDLSSWPFRGEKSLWGTYHDSASGSRVVRLRLLLLLLLLLILLILLLTETLHVCFF